MTRTRLNLAAALAVLLLAFGAPLALAEDETITPDNSSNADFMQLKTLVDAGDYATALPQLQALNTQTPNNPDVLNLIGFSLRKTGHADQALDFYNKALALKPDHLGANEYLGELYLQLGDIANARRQLARLDHLCAYGCAQREELSRWIEVASN